MCAAIVALDLPAQAFVGAQPYGVRVLHHKDPTPALEPATLYLVSEGSRTIWLAAERDHRLYVYVPNFGAFVYNDALTLDWQIDRDLTYASVTVQTAADIIAAGKVGKIDERTNKYLLDTMRAETRRLQVTDALGAKRLHEAADPESVSVAHPSAEHLTTISATAAQHCLPELIALVNTGGDPVRITHQSGDVVLVSGEEYDSWQGTIHLLRTPPNAHQVMAAAARDLATRPPGEAAADEEAARETARALRAEAEALAADTDDQAEAAQVLRDMSDE